MQKQLKDLNYGIVGLGIMGGSFAKAIREKILSSSNSTGKIYACNRSTACLEMAKKDKIIDESFTSDCVQKMLPLCDIVFICLYPHKTLDFLLEHKNDFKQDSIVTDISGVKGIFEKSLPENFSAKVDFIIGHPMAGGEKEGYGASNAKFFENHNYLLIERECNKAQNIELIKELIYAMGFSRITRTTCEEHDYKIGFTSQLCHVIASALVESAMDEGVTAFGGGSFEDLTRIALINAPMWTELFISNKEKLCAHIENFEKNIEQFKNLINSSDEEGLKALLEDVRQKRTNMGSIRKI